MYRSDDRVYNRRSVDRISRISTPSGFHGRSEVSLGDYN